MRCWYCCWGWPPEVKAIYERFDEFDVDLDYGPGHIVWADENFSNEDIDFCIEFGKKERHNSYKDMPDKEFQLAMLALIQLREVPEDIRLPEAYRRYCETDEMNPENFPPDYKN